MSPECAPHCMDHVYTRTKSTQFSVCRGLLALPAYAWVHNLDTRLMADPWSRVTENARARTLGCCQRHLLDHSKRNSTLSICKCTQLTNARHQLTYDADTTRVTLQTHKASDTSPITGLAVGGGVVAVSDNTTGTIHLLDAVTMKTKLKTNGVVNPSRLAYDSKRNVFWCVVSMECTRSSVVPRDFCGETPLCNCSVITNRRRTLFFSRNAQVRVTIELESFPWSS
jgi:hypothetical protein